MDDQLKNFPIDISEIKNHFKKIDIIQKMIKLWVLLKINYPVLVKSLMMKYLRMKQFKVKINPIIIFMKVKLKV